MDIFGPIAALAGVAMQAKAQQDANNLNWASLFETKRTNRKQEKLATSSQRDAYGNEVYYDPVYGWRIKTTPRTKGILDAEQKEQFKSLSEDAPRQRGSAERRNKRAVAADDLYEEQFNKYRYRPQKSENEYVGDTTKLLLSGRQKGLDEASSAMARQLVRSGNGSDISRIFKDSADMYASGLEEALLKGKAVGKQQYRADRDTDDSALQKELSLLNTFAGDTDSAPIRFGNDNQRLSDDAAGALTQLLSTIGSNEGRRLQSTAALAQTLGESPDFGALASSLKGLGSGMMGGGKGGAVTGTSGSVATRSPYIPFPRPYEEGQLARSRAYGGF